MALLLDRARTVKRTTLEWSERETILYALGIGLGVDPLDPLELGFVYERGLKAMPTLLTALARILVPTVPELGGDHTKTVHAQQSAVFHRPVPARGKAQVEGTVVSIFDRGPGRGAQLVTRAEVKDLADGSLLATLESVVLARGDGGFGGPPPPPGAHIEMPDRPADRVVSLAVASGQAAIYRLSGDLNPLHIEPAFAQAAGFPRPILHGLCSYGIACRAVLNAFAPGQAERVRAHATRFVSPAYPGEPLRFELWEEPDGVLFEGWAAQRNEKILAGGRTVLAPVGQSASTIGIEGK